MSYYDDKLRMQKDIRKLIEQKETLEDIEFYILTKYGFGEKVVRKYYEKLKQRGKIKE